jgi:hypothetical protein
MNNSHHSQFRQLHDLATESVRLQSRLIQDCVRLAQAVMISGSQSPPSYLESVRAEGERYLNGLVGTYFGYVRGLQDLAGATVARRPVAVANGHADTPPEPRLAPTPPATLAAVAATEPPPETVTERPTDPPPALSSAVVPTDPATGTVTQRPDTPRDKRRAPVVSKPAAVALTRPTRKTVADRPTVTTPRRRSAAIPPPTSTPTTVARTRPGRKTATDRLADALPGRRADRNPPLTSSPAAVELTGRAGGVATGSFTITNPTGKAVRVSLVGGSFVAVGDTAEPSAEFIAPLTVEPETLELGPRESAGVTVRLPLAKPHFAAGATYRGEVRIADGATVVNLTVRTSTAPARTRQASANGRAAVAAKKTSAGEPPSKKTPAGELPTKKTPARRTSTKEVPPEKQD